MCNQSLWIIYSSVNELIGFHFSEHAVAVAVGDVMPEGGTFSSSSPIKAVTATAAAVSAEEDTGAASSLLELSQSDTPILLTTGGGRREQLVQIGNSVILVEMDSGGEEPEY